MCGLCCVLCVLFVLLCFCLLFIFLCHLSLCVGMNVVYAFVVLIVSLFSASRGVSVFCILHAFEWFCVCVCVFCIICVVCVIVFFLFVFLGLSCFL